MTATASAVLAGMLSRGFTTVRDAGGWGGQVRLGMLVGGAVWSAQARDAGGWGGQVRDSRRFVGIHLLD